RHAGAVAGGAAAAGDRGRRTADRRASAARGRRSASAPQRGRAPAPVCHPEPRSGRQEELMLEFLLALLATATVGVLLIPLLREKTTAHGRFEGELAIYRDQLAEIERESVAGVLAEADAAAARLEVERRILAAADNAPSSPATARDDTTLHKYLPPALA